AGRGQQNALQSGDRLGRRRVEVRELIVAFLKRRLVLETSAQIHREGARYLPIVLQIPVVTRLQKCERGPDRETASVRRTQQGARQTVAGGGGRRRRIRTLGVVPAERKVARRIIRPERVELTKEHVVAGFDRVSPFEPSKMRLH